MNVGRTDAGRLALLGIKPRQKGEKANSYQVTERTFGVLRYAKMSKADARLNQKLLNRRAETPVPKWL